MANVVTDAFSGMFKTVEPGVAIPKIANLADVSMTVQELSDFNDQNTFSDALVNISGVDISEGQISSVVIEHKKTSSSTWETLPLYPVTWPAIADNLGSFLVKNIAFSKNGVQHDFRAYFLNTDGEKAYCLTAGKTIGYGTNELNIAGKNIVTGVSFNGVPDLAEYPSVTGLKVTNADVTDGGTYASPAKLPNTGKANLSWDDMKSKGTLAAHPLANGGTATVSERTWKSLEEYLVYMYIASTGAPTTGKEYPTTDTNGTWYQIAKTKSTSIEIDCPRNKLVAFYVCAKVPLTGTSGLADITTMSYSQY